MYLSELDIIAITIALITSFGLILLSASANARMTNERNYWRQIAMYDDNTKALLMADDCCLVSDPCFEHEEVYENRTVRIDGER